MGVMDIDENGLFRHPRPRAIPFGPGVVAAILDHIDDPSAVALVDRGETLDYAETHKRVRAAAAALVSLGLRAGDRVAASSASHNSLVIAFLATQRLGLIWVGINRGLATPEKRSQLVDSGAAVLLADSETAGQLEPIRDTIPALRAILTTSSSADAQWPVLIHRHTDVPCPPVGIDPFGPAAISYTSGTSGVPKGAVHSQHSIMTFVNGGIASGRGGPWQRGLRRGMAVPVTVLNSMNFGPLIALVNGGSYVSMDRVDAAGVAEWIERARIEVLGCAPTTIRDLLTRPDLQHYDLSSLRFVFSGGASGTVGLRDIYRQRFRSELVEEYGMTEAPSAVAGSRSDRLPAPGTVGEAHVHVDVIALDEAGAPLPPGEVGEICVRAPRNGEWAQVFTGMLGYWGKPDETRAALRGGWLHTGDTGSVDAERNVSVVGRKSDLIIRGGANIYPAEIERVLLADPDIAEAVVMGLPDERLGEIVAAYICLKEDALKSEAHLLERLQKRCAANLARFKIPQRWFLVPTIPRNTTNKPLKAALREGHRKELQ